MTRSDLTLTPKESLANRIANDTRNLDAWEAMYDVYKLRHLGPLVVDCAVRYTEATSLDKELARIAEANLRRASSLWSSSKL